MLAPNSILRSRYRIVQLIGKGGMGAVYEAIDQTFENVVAIKQMLVGDEYLRKAFEREARLLNRLRHRALPVVTDYFFEDNGEFLVMQFIPGDDLGAMMKKRAASEYPQGVPKAYDLERVLNWADQLLDALDYLHTQNPPILHRDIKPQNLKLNERGEIILLDFGLAKGAATGAGQTTGFTSIYGYTPSYAPLEQIQGSGTSTRSDLYSLAATVYNLLTGVTPADALTRATAAVSGKPDPLAPLSRINARVFEPVSNILMQALAQNPELRPQSAIEMRDALRQAPRQPSNRQAAGNQEKDLFGNRIVVQLKPEEAGKQKTATKAQPDPNRIREGGASGGTKVGPGTDTQATIVRPKKVKTNLQEPAVTDPDPEGERKPKHPSGSKPSPPVITPKPSLSQRRQEILELLVEGCDDAEIASRLSLAKSDVADFITRLRHDTGVITRKDLIIWAMTQGVKSHMKRRVEKPDQQGPSPDPNVAAKVGGTSGKPFGFNPPAPPINLDPQTSPPIPDNSGRFAPKPNIPEPKPQEIESESSPLANFIGAIVLGFFAIGAGLTMIQELAKGQVRTFGEVMGVLVLAGIALALGLACLGAILNFFSALKKK